MRRRFRTSRPKLLAVDLDGTLLHPKTGKPHERDIRALHAAVKQGVAVTIVTGRLYSGTREIAELLGVRGPVACVDGSHFVDAESHVTLLHHGVRGENAVKLRDVIARYAPASFLFAKDAILHDAGGKAYVDYVSTWSTDVSAVESLAAHPFWLDEDGITAVASVGTQAEMQAAAAEIKSVLGDAVQVVAFRIRTWRGTWGLVVRAAGNSKGTALRWLAAHHGCEPYETVCVGDWLNDIPMFLLAGRSYAMAHSPREVQRAATLVVETADKGGGLARVVEDMFGIVTP